MPIKDPQRNREYQRKWQRDHYETHGRPYYQTHREKYKHTRDKWLSQYGITEAQWNATFEAQGKRCAICKTDTAARWATDHCHVTNKFRGVLCLHCNVTLGNMKDSPQLLRDAALYLEARQ